MLWPESEWLLLDGSVKRCSFLEDALVQLELGGRATVLAERAEVAGRTALRATFDLVVARSFAAPAVTAECGSPFLRAGGRLLVAEPPGGDPERWDQVALAELGLELVAGPAGPTSHQSLIQASLCPERYPRRVGVPAKRPLF
jgi:16S rRNA (guanine527-N7)-methyltransferase